MHSFTLLLSYLFISFPFLSACQTKDTGQVCYLCILLVSHSFPLIDRPHILISSPLIFLILSPPFLSACQTRETGQVCRFPFLYEGVEYRGCEEEKTHLMCGLVYNVTHESQLHSCDMNHEGPCAGESVLQLYVFSSG